MRIIATGPIISWQIDGKKLETVTDFILLGSKITADGDSSHKIKTRLLFGRSRGPAWRGLSTWFLPADA